MVVAYHHGARAFEVDDAIRPVQLRRYNTIGLVGTAPDADTDVFPVNTPVLIPGNRVLANQLGTSGDLPGMIARIFQITGAYVVVNRVEPGANEFETLSRISGNPVQRTGVHALLNAENVTGYKPRLIAAAKTRTRPPSGIISAGVGTGGAGFPTAPPVTVTGDGFGARLRATVNNGAVTSLIVENPGSGYTTATISFGGPGTGATATAVIGGVANPVAVDLAATAKKLRAMSFISGPGTNFTAGLAYRNDFGSDRVNIIDGLVSEWDDEENIPVDVDPVGYALGMQARIDDDLGPHEVYSNKPIEGIIGIPRAIEYIPNDTSSEHNAWNENRMTIPVRRKGFKLLGARTTANDPLYAFINVRRIMDMVMDALEDFAEIYIDDALTPHKVKSVVWGTQEFIDSLKANEWVIGGKCWFNGDFNTPQDLVSGVVTFDFDLEPTGLMEHIRFRAHRNPNYYKGFVEEIIRDTTV